MTVQRYVFRYKPHKAYEDHLERFRGMVCYTNRYGDHELMKMAQDAHDNHLRLYDHRPYEKEGGGLTSELTEAKIIGWKSAKRWATGPTSERGDLLPVNISLVNDDRPSWRCINCKEVWHGAEMPDRCGSCCCSSFARVAA